MADSRPRDESYDGCTSDRCPRCGKSEFVTVERVIVGGYTVVQCHCRACEASWVAGKKPNKKT
jgi:hypothetical protein